MSPLILLLIAILVLQVIAFAIAVIARFWVLRSEVFVLRGIDVARATDLVAFYVQGVHDHRFGFPTGVFAVDEARTSPGSVVAKEINFKGSAGMAPIKFGLALPMLGLAAGASMGSMDDDGGGCLAGLFGAWIGFSLGLAAAVVLVVPFAFLAIVEVMLRMLMRGEITASIAKAAGEEDAVHVQFTLRGLSAFGAEHQLRRGMAPPLPDEMKASPVSGGPSADGGQGEPEVRSHFDRLNTIYAAAVSVGIVASAAIFLALGNLQTSGPDAAALSPVASDEYGEYDEYGRYDEYGESGDEHVQSSAARPTRFQQARSVYRRYWNYIATGRYGAAYGIYHSSFETDVGVSRFEFIAAERRYLPRVQTRKITVRRSSRRPSSPAELWIYAEVPIVDRAGEYAGQCRVFYGDARMFRQYGRWYYRPGEYRGRAPSFGNSDLGGGIRYLSSDSPRCP